MVTDYWHTFLPDQFYHIYNHAAGDRDIFNSDTDYLDFIIKFDRYFSGVFQTIAYCLMPNHFHFLVKSRNQKSLLETAIIQSEEELDPYVLDVFRRFFSSFALAYNFRNKTRGQLFLKRCKRVAVDEEKRLQNLVCYIHHNPIHHGFATEYESWRYSSYSQNAPNGKSITTQLLDCFTDKGDYHLSHERFKLNYEKGE